MQKPDGKGTHRLLLSGKDGKSVEVELQVSWRKLTLLPPQGKQKHWPPLELTVIHAIENGPDDRGGREPVEWKLVCSLEISSLAQAVEKLQWYALRWKIEVFHKVLKSGCRAEESQLRTAERVVKLIAVLCIVGWRVFWLTMIQRNHEQTSANIALTALEQDVLRRYAMDRQASVPHKHDMGLHESIIALARLGGYLNRKTDRPPGTMVIWRGLRRLEDMLTGYNLSRYG